MKFEWEVITGGVRRAKVLGGWLVNVYEETTEGYYTSSCTFISDPHQEWSIDNEQKES